jgi:aminopeptidase N
VELDAGPRVQVRRTEYRPPDLALERVELDFDLGLESATVQSRLWVHRPPGAAREPLRLDGEQLELESLKLDGRALPSSAVQAGPHGLSVDTGGAEAFVLQVGTRLAPRANTALLGLYASGRMLLTQCEAQGFRRITYFPDRPDVLARYRVQLRADRRLFPVLLSNGNLVEEGPLPGERHFATWVDPHPKPSYLFALVAGPLQCRASTFATRSGRAVQLQLWADGPDLPRLEHAAQCLARAAAWDEVRFGLELDLERYMVVAVRDFNFGAMENKGLNLFNTRYVLADPSVATDEDYSEVDATVAHEYFHNWTGNRVTCRDWFQLCLKEGLTVYREQEYVNDTLAQGFSEPGCALSARCVPRIQAVRTLRTDQFAEDAGPMAHAVRPDAYLEISNFYTSTVYRKGAEVVRMLATLAGPAAFREGFDRFIARHDGTAVTCEQFVQAIAEGAGIDLARFMRWYSQAGTPHVAVNAMHDPESGSLELTFVQSCAPTPGQERKEPMLIPIEIGLIGPDGSAQPLRAGDGDRAAGTSRVIVLSEAVQSFRFHGLAPGTIPSLLRNFSAPVRIDYPYDEAQLALLARHDADPCNRWDALQRLLLARMAAAADALEAAQSPAPDEAMLTLLRDIARDPALAPAFREVALQLPAESLLADARAVVVPEALHRARLLLQQQIGAHLHEDWAALYQSMKVDGPYRPDPVPAGRRALRNLALEFLAAAGDAQALQLAHRQLVGSDNLSDRLAALTVLVNSPSPSKAEWLVQLARDWHNEPLLMNKWFRVQATSHRQPGEPPVLDRVRALLRHHCYSEHDPQSVNALVLGFCADNPAGFHLADGSGYAFWFEQVTHLDRVNPILAARVARCLERWRRFMPALRQRMHAALQQVAAQPSLSADVREVVDRALKA